MADIEAAFTGACDPQDAVGIRLIIGAQPACSMNRTYKSLDLWVEDTGIFRVCYEQGRCALRDSGLERIETAGGEALLVAFERMEKTGWIMASIVKEDRILASVGALRDEIEKSTDSLVFGNMLPFGLVMLLIMLLIGYILTSAITNPIRKLQRGVAEVGTGRFVQVDIDSRDELGGLAKSFNDMTQQLKKYRARLGSHEKELEKEVTQRTKELEKSKIDLESKVEELERFNKMSVGRELKMVELKKRIRELEGQKENKSGK